MADAYDKLPETCFFLCINERILSGCEQEKEEYDIGFQSVV